MNKVPFFANPDNEHCLQAGIRSVLKYYLPEKDFSWDELEELTDFVKGKGTWANKVLVSLFDMGFQVKDISTFNIGKFIEDGDAYLHERYGKEAGLYAVENSDIAQEQRTYARVNELGIHETRVPTMQDIKEYLDDGWLPCTTVNSKLLNGEPGFAGHFVVIIGYDTNGVVIHDSGPNPLEHRHVTFEEFDEAWSIPDDNSKLLQVFKLSK